MKRYLLVVVLGASACASGTKPGFGDGDAPVPADASPRDGRVDELADAPIDARPDAPPPPTPDATVIPPDAPPPDACVPVVTQRLANPVFDLAPTGVGWTEIPLPNLPGGPYPLITADGLAAHTAPNKVWFGGAAGINASPAALTLTDQLFQDIAIPANTVEITITGFFAVGTTESGSQVFDTFTLDILKLDGTPIENIMQLNNTMAVNVFTPFSKTISAGGLAQMAGQTVRLRGTSTNDIFNNSNFFFDTLAFNTVGCP
ncbi:MAG: hypothetical protein KF773_34160 [Deltaproteobacteria bacterium]|nr:hypothetical protein [Deltaproteobacteria bacterium]